MFSILRSVRASDDEGGYLEIDDFIDRGVGQGDWSKGLPLGRKRDALAMPARAVRGYKGPAADFYCFRIPLMSERMVKVLEQAGVDNLETCPVTLIEKSGKRRQMLAVNIVGRARAADLAQSEWTSDHDPPVGDAIFGKLVVASALPRDFLLFRMAESLSTIVVHDSLKRAIEQANLSGVEFVAPQAQP